MRLILLTASALALSACATVPAPQPNSVPGMVSAADPRAAEAGAQMLRMGGSATDAALATLLALTVVEPQSSGIGGGGFLVRSDAAGHVTTFDGREIAPLAAGPDWFLDSEGRTLPMRAFVPGGRSVGVPGNVAMMKLAHDRYGKLPWASLFQPAIKLARDGFVITPRLHGGLARNISSLGEFSTSTARYSPDSQSLFYGADGEPHPVGHVVRNPALADFLERLADEGPSAFYEGQNPAAITAAVNADAKAPAPMAVTDFAAYQAKERPPVCAPYRQHLICSMGPPSSGATTVIAILKQLERFDMAALGPHNPLSWHLFAESTRLAFADRNAYLGDGDYVDVPVAGLIDEAYLAQRSMLISPDRAMIDVPVGHPAGAVPAGSGIPVEEQGTSHFVTTDRAGNVVSLTSTVESSFGSGLMVNGYFLNNELTDFNFSPVDTEGRPAANRVEGGKRPRSSMSPTIVFGPDGHVRLAVGAAGGATIIVQTAKNIMAVIDWGMGAEEALAVPNLFAPGGAIFVEEVPGSAALMDFLRSRGHADVRPTRSSRFKANAIEWKDGRWIGAADPRSEGRVVMEAGQ